MVRRRERCMLPLRKTEEPAKKKPKVDGDEDSDDSEGGDSINNDLIILQKHLMDYCLCEVPGNSIYNLIISNDGVFDLSEWDSEKTLKFLSCVHVLCEINLRQTADGLVCTRIGNVCSTLVRNGHDVVEQIINWLSHTNQVVGYVACKALSSFLIVCQSNVQTQWLDSITDRAVTTTVPRSMSLSLDVLKRVVEWKDKSQHPLEVRGDRGTVRTNCQATSLMDTENPDSSDVKCMCIKVLEAKWPMLYEKVDQMMKRYRADYECAVITFLSLWESIVAIKTNLSVIDTKPFYFNLPHLVVILNPSVPASVWKHTFNLLNEVLCYGSTLALQDSLAEEPCALAHHIMRSVKDWRLLDFLPYHHEGGGFGGSAGVGDKPLLQKMVLLVLKSVAITAKETRYESSSDSSVGSEADDVDADMALIERSIREVLRKLDVCVKTRLHYHPSMPMSQWIVQLLTDQDDALIEGMVCCLDVSMGFYHRPNIAPNPVLSPTSTLLAFFQVVSHDPEVLLDLLTSNETCFLLYLLRILKFIRRYWEEFVEHAGAMLHDTMTVFIRLRFAIDRLVQRALFPYNIAPVLRQLEKIEELYEQEPCA